MLSRTIEPYPRLRLGHRVRIAERFEGTVHSYIGSQPIMIRRPTAGAVVGSISCDTCGETLTYEVVCAAATMGRRRKWAALACAALLTLALAAGGEWILLENALSSPDFPLPGFFTLLVIAICALGAASVYWEYWYWEDGVRGPGFRAGSKPGEHSLHYPKAGR